LRHAKFAHTNTAFNMALSSFAINWAKLSSLCSEGPAFFIRKLCWD